MQIPEFFSFYNKTRITSGKKAIENIPFELGNMDACKPIIITDKQSAQAGFVKTLIKSFGDSGLTIGAIYDNVSYSTIGTIKEISELFIARGCDSIISLGGESVTSVAKGVNIIVSNELKDLSNFEAIKNNLNLKPLFFIATSLSTGTETSSSAIIDGKVLSSSELMPDIAFIDQRMLRRFCDRESTLLSAIRSIGHSIEACSQSNCNPMIDSFAFSSIQLIAENIFRATKTITCSKSKVGLANGLAIAGIVSSNAMEGFCSYTARLLSKTTNFSFDLLYCTILPHFLDFKLKSTKESIREELLLPIAGIDIYCSSDIKERADKAVAMLFDIIRESKVVPPNLSSLKIPEYKVEEALLEAEKIYDSQFGKKGCQKILKSAFSSDIINGGEQ